MLLNSGTTSLLGYTRDLAGDPSTAPSTLFSDQRVKDAINESYLELYDVARQFGVGDGVKRSYADTVASQLFYELPDDVMKMLMVEVEGNGKNLSSDTTADPSQLKVLSADVALSGYNAGVYTATEYYFIANGPSGTASQHMGIVSPATTAGTSSLRITYEAEAVDLTNDTDEPDLPGTYHSLICYRAAIVLRETMDLDTRGLERIANRKEIRFMNAMHDNVADFEGQAWVAGLKPSGYITKMGRAVKS